MSVPGLAIASSKDIEVDAADLVVTAISECSHLVGGAGFIGATDFATRQR